MNQTQSTTIMIMAGGTGGHIFPGLAVAAELQALGASVTWMGARQGLENELVPRYGIPLDTLEISGLRGKGLLGWLLAPLRIVKAVLGARRIFSRARPACVLSMGGYAAGPGGIAAWLSNTPLVVHEQNRIAGLTNKVLSRLAATVFEGFPQTFRPHPKITVAGNPVRQEIQAITAPEQRLAGRSGAVRLLVLGGSQGAESLNRVLPEALAMTALEPALDILHQAGRSRAESVRHRYQSYQLQAEVSEFIDDMATAYGQADLVICRAGALTVAEVAAAGVAAIFIPFPYAVDDHQTRNAEYLEAAGAARILSEKELTAAKLAQLISVLCSNRDRLLQMARCARQQAHPEAAATVARRCLELAQR